jgi:cell division protein FtsQ
MRDDFDDQYTSPSEDRGGFDSSSTRRHSGIRLRLRGGIFRIPRTRWGRIFGGAAILAILAVLIAVTLFTRSFFLHDERFLIQSSSAIETVGNTHLARAQLLDVFGADIERNIFTFSLAERRHQLESIPWVEHATVMRLLPNRLRVAVVERTPVAFVRQGTQIGLADATGVLLDMPPDAPGDPHYSFPVITGLNPADPLSTRAARMKLYLGFARDLDSTGQNVSQKLSEVDLSDPEDVKALIPEGASDILVHFGDTNFLTRYQRFQQLLPEWRAQYPTLASADMRYDRQVVLEMQATAQPGKQPGKQPHADPASTSSPAAPKPAPHAASTKPSHPKSPKLSAKPKPRPASAQQSTPRSSAPSHTIASTAHPGASKNTAPKKPSIPANSWAPRSTSPNPAPQAGQH